MDFCDAWKHIYSAYRTKVLTNIADREVTQGINHIFLNPKTPQLDGAPSETEE